MQEGRKSKLQSQCITQKTDLPCLTMQEINSESNHAKDTPQIMRLGTAKPQQCTLESNTWHHNIRSNHVKPRHFH